VQFPDVQEPFPWGTKSTPASNPRLFPGYGLVLSGDQNIDQINFAGSQKIIVNGTARLYVKGNVSMTGSSQIVLGAGANLQIFVGGASGEIGEKGVLNSGSPANFTYWGLNSNTSVKYTGNASFNGMFYAPYADLTMGGGGSGTPIDFTGSSISKTVKMNGKFNFHYDEALGRLGPRRGYTVVSWKEIAKFP